MPYVDIHILKQKNTEKKDLFSRRKALHLNDVVNSTWQLSNTLKLRDTSGKKLWLKMGEFEEAIRNVSRDPKDPENRELIEKGIDTLEELGDFLGAPGPDGTGNIYTYLKSFAEDQGKEEDFDYFKFGLKHLNEVLELRLDLDSLEDGKVIRSTPQQRDERAKRIQDRTETRATDERIEREAAVRKKNAALKRAQQQKEKDDAQRKYFEDIEKKRKEKEERERAEKERLEAERKKTEEQKALEKEAARQKELKRQTFMRETIDESIDKYQDPTASADTKKMHMA